MRQTVGPCRWWTAVAATAITSTWFAGFASAESTPAGVPATTSPDGQLAEVVVTGHYQFLSVDTQGTTNLPLPIEQVPQSIDLISADFIQAASLKTLGDIASYTPGAINAGNPENNGTVIDIRGFPAGRAIDGIDTISSYVSYEPDFAVFDRLEVVEGPSSVVYGISSPGGLVNYVTKSATSQTPSYLYAQLGSWNNYRLEGQVAQALDSQGRVRVIGVAALDDGDSFTNDLNHHKAVAYAGINADVTDSLSTYLHAGYERYTRPSFDGIPTLPDGSPAPVSNSLLIGSKDIRIVTSAYYATGDVTWKPDDVLEFTLKGNYENAGITGGNEYGYGLQSNGDFNFNVTRFDGVQRTVNYGVGASSVVHFDALGLKDSFLSLSMLYQDSKEGTDVLAPANQGTANIFSTQSAISQAFDSLYFGPLPYPYVSEIDTRTLTFSAQSVTKVFDRLAILVGASYSRPEVDTTTNGSIQNYDFSGQVSYRAGLTYEFLPKAYAYVSYSESFEPQALLTVEQTVLPPVSGKQYEAGIKYRPTAGLLLTGAVYRIVESNVGQYAESIDGVDFYAPIGQVTNKGFEIKALGQFTKNWQINAGYAYLDPLISGAISTPGSSLAATVGQTQLYLPKQTFSLYSTYTLPDGALQGLSVGGGIRHVASELTSYESALANSEEGLVPTNNIPAYTLVDLNLGYDFGPWTARLIVSNLFDQKYFINNYQTLFYGNAPGAPTNFSLSLRRTF
jgi:iron complex outermembrane receptor protein